MNRLKTSRARLKAEENNAVVILPHKTEFNTYTEIKNLKMTLNW